MDNIFANVDLGPPIEVFQLTANFNKDQHPDKVNLGVGGELKSVQYFSSRR